MNIDYSKNGNNRVIVVFQNADDNKVLAIDLFTEDEVNQLIYLSETGKCWRCYVTLFELWRIVEIAIDCDRDTLLVTVDVPGKFELTRLEKASIYNQPWFGSKNILVPIVVQDNVTGKVLMVGVMNKVAFKTTLKIGRVTFYSRTRKKLWTKGETSGMYLQVREVFIDNAGNSILIKADPVGPVCHTGAISCFENVDGTIREFPEEEKL